MRVVAEGAVIVVSILLAFGIDAAWEARQERRFEQDALARLEVEFTENLDRIDQSSFGRMVANGAALQQMMQSVPVEAESLAVPDTLLAGLLAAGTFDRINPVLDGLLRSGRFEAIRNRRVREAVATWERWLTQLGETELSARAFVDTQLRPALVTHGDVSRLFARDPRSLTLAGSDAVTLLRIDNQLKALVAEKHARDQTIRRQRARVRASLLDLLDAISQARGT